jgi:pilus assembly protein Flp/PilA
VSDASGATAIEYALIGAIVSLAVVAGATAIGAGLPSKFNGIAAALR